MSGMFIWGCPKINACGWAGEEAVTGQGEDLCCDADPSTSPASEKGLEHRQPFNTVLGRPAFVRRISVTGGHQRNECDLGEVAL